MTRRIALLLAASVAAVGIGHALRVASRDAVASAREDPAFIGAPVLLAEGRAGGLMWELLGRRSDAGTCLEIRDSGGGRTLGCGFGVPQRHALGFLIHRTPDGRPLLAAGPVVSEAVTVRLSLDGGGNVKTTPVRPLVDDGERAFVVDVSTMPDVLAAEALDRDGAVLGRRGLDLDDSGLPIMAGH